MLIFAPFIALSPLLIVAAPLPVSNHPTTVHSNPRGTLYRRAPPKFEIPHDVYVKKSDQEDTLNKMMEHYNTKSTNEQRGAGLIIAASRWSRNPIGRQQKMKLNYHAGDITKSPIIGPPAEIYREKPVPKMYFDHVRKPHQEEVRTQSKKRYNDLSDERASKVKSMKAWGNWDSKSGITQKTELTFHSHAKPNMNNIIGTPVEIQRPLTLRISNVPLMDRIPIGNDVRAAHKQMIANEQHPASKSNYGTVDSGWHDSLPDADGNTHKQVVVHLHEVSEDEKQRTPLGSYPVRKSSSDHESPVLNADSSTLHTGTSSTGPSRLNSEVPYPSASQDHLRLTIGSLSTNALPLNTRSPHQGTSQFDAGSPPSYPGSSDPVSVSLHPALQPHVDSPSISQDPLRLTLGSLSANALHSETSFATPSRLNNEVTSFGQSKTSAFKRWQSALPPTTEPSHLNNQGPTMTSHPESKPPDS